MINKYIYIKIILLKVLIFIGTVGLFSQNPIEVKPLIYMDSLKRIYVKDSMPVYFFMSYTTDKNQSVQLQSNSPHANPMYFDGHGNHFIKHEDNFLEEYVEFHIFNDAIKPVTTIEFDKKKLVLNKKYYSKADVLITLKAKDELSGIQKVFYSLDGNPFMEYKNGFQLTEEKEYLIKYYAVDNVGNMEKYTANTIIIDATAPVTEHSFDKNFYQNILSVRTSIILKAKDITGIEKIIYRIDDQPEKVYTTPIKTTLLSEGEHKLYYYSFDLLGNKEIEKNLNFYIDKSPPMVVEEMEGNNYVVGGKEYASGKSKVKLTAIDNKSGVQFIYYSINNGPFIQYNKPFYLSSDKSGMMTFKSYAIDNVNNKTSSETGSTKMKIPYVDLTGPNIIYSIEGNSFKNQDSLVLSKNSKIILKATDFEAGVNKITYSLNGAPDTEYTVPILVEKEGYYSLLITGYDNVENLSKKTLTFSVDNTGPEVYTRFSIPSKGKKEVNGVSIDVYPSHAILFLSATDLFVGIQKIYYTLNADIEKPYDKMIQGFTKGKTYHIKIKALDMLGNFTISETDFYIE